MTTEIEEKYIQAVEKAGACMVSVRTGISPQGHCCGPFQKGGLGSGVVLDKEGHILTSHHAVGQTEQVTVIMNNGHLHTGKVVGEDRRTDIAVIKIEADDLVPAELGDSDKLRIGQPILAMGNPLGLPEGPVVTSGVVSSLRRGLVKGQNGMAFIVTDASVNPGNGGGILVNLDGQVIAVNTARIPFPGGMSYAVPINMAKDIAEQLIEHGKVERSWLGVTAYDVTPPLAYRFQLPDTDGVFVAEVLPEGPAEAAGLRLGDVLLSLDDKHLGSVTDLLVALSGMKAGQEIIVKVRRNGKTEEVHVTLGTRPF